MLKAEASFFALWSPEEVIAEVDALGETLRGTESGKMMMIVSIRIHHMIDFITSHHMHVNSITHMQSNKQCQLLGHVETTRHDDM